jgi:hypothetical protein
VAALMELTVTLDTPPLTTERQLLFLRALDNVSIDCLVWACEEAGRVCEYFPVPAVLRKLASQAPRICLPTFPEQLALPPATYYEDGSRRIQEIIDSLVVDWGLPTTRSGRV